MPYAITDIGSTTRTCKELIIKSLSGAGALSAKKVHYKIKKEFSSTFSYQAVHKALRSLTNDGILKKFRSEYYLNQAWIEYLYRLAMNLRESKMIGAVERNLQTTDYTQKIKIQAIRFVPFHLGSFTRKEELLSKVKTIHEQPHKITFQWKGNSYAWYETGVCVQTIRERAKEFDVVSFLLDRRKTHLELLSITREPTKHIVQLAEMLNLKDQLSLKYVMSIHGVSNSDDNIVRLLTDPRILGIHDNRAVDINETHISNAYRILEQTTGNIDSPHIYDAILSNGKKSFASWSNVVFTPPDESFIQQLIQIECNLQNLWFYFYSLKNELRRKLRQGKLNQSDVTRKINYCLSLWHEFENVNATDDIQTTLIKDALIKTSKITKVYNELKYILNSA